PTTEIKVMTETNVLLGRRYRNASSSSNGKPDMGGKLWDRRRGVNETYPRNLPIHPVQTPPPGIHSEAAWVPTLKRNCSPAAAGVKRRPGTNCSTGITP